MVSNFQGRSEALARVLRDARGGGADMTGEGEALLVARTRAGDADAAAALVEANLGRVVRLARLHAGRGLPLEDLIHEGVVGLLLAVPQFDPSRQVRFFTYASFFARRAMVEALARSCKVVRLPRGTAARFRRMRESPDGMAAEPSSARPGPIPTFEISIDASREGGRAAAEALAAATPSPAEEVLASEMRAELRSALAVLPDRERRVLAARFGLGQDPRTLRQVGAELRLSKERVRQLEERATERLRQRLTRSSPFGEGGPGPRQPVA